MRLVFVNTARRFVGLAILLFLALPLGLSVTGCGHKAAPVVYCFAGDTGPVVGQAYYITLSQSLSTTGESLNYGQIGAQLSATATDCKHNPVTVKAFTWASTSSFENNPSGGPIVADINPSNGQVCGGTWNRNTGGGIANYTTCTPPSPAPAPAPTVAVTVPATLTAPSTSQAGASPYTYTAQAAGLLSIQNSTDSTISTITTTTNGTAGTASVGVPFFVVPGETIAITYTTTDNPPTLTFTSAYAYTASAPGALQIIGGTVSAIYDYVAASNGTTVEGSTSGVIPVNKGDIVGVVYTGAPTAIFIPSGAAAIVTAEANGVTSNGIAVYVHPVATGVELGGATANCSVDPGTDCCPAISSGTPIVAPVYDGSSCLSQNHVGQLVARVYQNGGTTGDAADNITCSVGPLTYSAQTQGIVSIDENGAATAQNPGSTTITTTTSLTSSASSVGYFSTCPPASITLANPNAPGNSIDVAVNTLQPLTATVLDTQGNPITGLTLEFNSTTPQTIPAAVGSVTPAYPGSADITAVCQPSSCNPAPFNQIGLYGNGKAITSNPITINTPGTSSTVLYMGSTGSDYVAFRDFTTNEPSTLIKLPFAPNSMVMNQAGTTIYLGSPEGLMSIATASNTVSAANQVIPGTVLSISPDGSTLVVTDPTRQTISLVSTATNTVATSYGGIATSASWSPDDQAVYITTQSGAVLTHSPYTDWQVANPVTVGETYTDVAVAVPSIGAFFAGPTTTDARSYCPSSTITTVANPSVVDNQFIPLAGQAVAITDQIAATTSGTHIIGAHAGANGVSTLSDIDVTLPTNANTNAGTDEGAACPMVVPTDYFKTAYGGPQTLTGVNAAAITGVFPSSNSAVAFVTYTGPSSTAPPGTTPNAILPWYIVPASGQGTLEYITLANGATANAAPVYGVFSTDNFTFYAGTGASDGTSADNDVHLITLTYPASGSPTATETGILSPDLPASSGTGYAPVNLLTQHPKKTTT